MSAAQFFTDSAETVSGSNYRDVMGDMWDTLGQLQLDFLKGQGMQPHHRLMDVGCGPLRLGSLAVDYLDPGHYFAIDASEELLDVGYNRELTDRQRERMPRSRLHTTEDFDFSFLNDQKMDVAMAQSLFTYLPLNHIRHLLARLYPRMVEGGAFYASFCLNPDHHDITQKMTHPVTEAGLKPIVSHDITAPYHYSIEDLEYCAKDMPWKFQFHGDWGHPCNLHMAAFIAGRDAR